MAVARPAAARVQAVCRRAFPAALLAVFAGSVIDTGQSPMPDVDDKLQHLAGYGLLAALALLGNPAWRAWQAVLPALLGYGLLIECVQAALPWRDFSLADLAANGAGIVAGLLAARAWNRGVSATAPRP